jgi:hypothetical protein
MNSSGKEWFAKLIATHIELLIKARNKSESVIPLNWKEKTMTLNITPHNKHENNMLSIEIDLFEDSIPSTQDSK